MGLLRVIASPNLCWLNVVQASNETGVPAIRLIGRSAERKFGSQFSAYAGPLRVAYSDDIDSLRYSKAVPAISRSRTKYVVLAVSGPETLLRRSGLSVEDSVDLTQTLKSLMDLSGNQPNLRLKDPGDPESDVVFKNQRDSILQKITQNLYRISDKAVRERVKKDSFRFLSGELRRPKSTGVFALDEVLSGELAKKFRECCLQTKFEHADLTSLQFGVDRFEVGYVLRKVSRDQDVLRNIEFPED